MINEHIQMALSSLWSNKMRSLLTMLGIIIGIGAVIAIMTVGNSLTNSVVDSMASMGASDITVGLQQKVEEEDVNKDGAVFGTATNTTVVTENDYITTDMISSLYTQYEEDIRAISASENVGSGSGQVIDDAKYANVTVTGASAGYYISNDLDFISGSYFSEDDFDNASSVAIVSDYLVKNIFDGKANRAMGQNISVAIDGKNYEYTIIGVYKYDASSSFATTSEYDTNTTIYIPLKTAMNANQTKGFTQFRVITKGNVDTEAFVAHIQDFMNGYYRNNHNFEISAYSMASMLDIMSTMMGTITTAISVIAGIALLVGGIGVMNIMLVSVTERTREIGTRKALGATNKSIRLQFIVEAMIICLIGGIIGSILGVLLGQLGAHILGYAASTSVLSVVASLTFSMAIGVFFGYYPANKAAKLNPIEALRYE